jgi:pimeloyl-ACP methyl ester carboxylesterase
VHAGFNADSILSRLSIPALFLLADPAAGGMMSEEDVARIKRLAPKSIMEFLPGVSHGLQLQDPERVAATVAEFALADPI